MVIYQNNIPIAYFDDREKGWDWLVDYCFNLIKKGVPYNEIIGNLKISEL